MTVLYYWEIPLQYSVVVFHSMENVKRLKSLAQVKGAKKASMRWRAMNGKLIV